MSGEFLNTPKQREIMFHVCEEAARGRNITFDELLARLAHKPSRSAMHCSLTFLKRHGFIVTLNRGKRGGNVIPTASGVATFKGAPVQI